MKSIGEAYAVPVVKRLTSLEQLSLKDLVQEVQAWQGREGVVIKFSDGEMVKVKSSWWITAGFTKEWRMRSKIWQEDEKIRNQTQQQKLRTRSQRLAILGNRMGFGVSHIFTQWPTARKVEMVYGKEGKLRVAIVSFDKEAQRVQAQEEAERLGLYAVRAYSNKTRAKDGVRVETFNRVNYM